MLSIIAVALLLFWLLGLATSYTMGGILHLLLVPAIAAALLHVIERRNPDITVAWRNQRETRQKRFRRLAEDGREVRHQHRDALRLGRGPSRRDEAVSAHGAVSLSTQRSTVVAPSDTAA